MSAGISQLKSICWRVVGWTNPRVFACNACRLCVPGLTGLDLLTLAKVAEGATIEVGGEGSPAKKS